MQGRTFKINRNITFYFYDQDHGLLVECDKSTGYITVMSPTQKEEDLVFTMEFEYYVTGPKCNSKQ